MKTSAAANAHVTLAKAPLPAVLGSERLGIESETGTEKLNRLSILTTGDENP